MNLLSFSRQLAEHVNNALRKATADLDTDFRSGKDKLKVDEIAYRAIVPVLKANEFNYYIESFESENHDYPINCYIDPVDGSSNFHRFVGEPGFVIAFSHQKPSIEFKDLFFAFAYSFRTGDFYYSTDGSSYYFNAYLSTTTKIITSKTAKLSNALGYIRLGYGGAELQLKRYGSVLKSLKDFRAFDNTAIEMGEIARGSADLMIEARGLSDFYNLLTYPLLRNAGGVVTDLNFEPIDNRPIEPKNNYDFIACANKELLIEIYCHPVFQFIKLSCLRKI